MKYEEISNSGARVNERISALDKKAVINDLFSIINDEIEGKNND